MGNSDPNELTQERKQQLDAVIFQLSEYFDTAEGQEFYEGIMQVFGKFYEPAVPELSELTARESKALAFIQKQLKKGHSPSVREVAAAVGLRSSRSGMRIVHALRNKRLLKEES